jgi:hypothetical protein
MENAAMPSTHFSAHDHVVFSLAENNPRAVIAESVLSWRIYRPSGAAARFDGIRWLTPTG